MELLIAFYVDPYPARCAEFLECIHRNASSSSIDRIHIFVEDPIQINVLTEQYPAFRLRKVTLVPHGRRVTYRDLFTYANAQLQGRPVIIANADIFFDHTLARLDGYDLRGELLCLSRWDVQSDGRARLFDYSDSQDAWIFDSPIPEFHCMFNLGVPGCDNRIAWEAQRAGLRLLNPSRSVRANHLHLTGVRRYCDRIMGAVETIPATYLNTPWLWFVVPCRGRLPDLRTTFNSVTGQPQSTYVLVDYSCPDGAGLWVREHDSRAIVVNCESRHSFCGADARNQGVTAVDDDGIVCFLDADVSVAPDFALSVLQMFEPGVFLIPDAEGPGLSTALVCSKAAFRCVGGLNASRGEEILHLRDSLRRADFLARTFSSALLRHRDRAATYQSSDTCLNGCDWVSPQAAIAFKEYMGYTIARLEVGVSSHNNDPRPFVSIPADLTGCAFTQVVAYSVSPVEVEFLSSGKLYVLVGTDWEGSRDATSWLRRSPNAFFTGLPPVQTCRGTGFEVWSLMGGVGDCLVLPTQVMLVAGHLERK
jgi:hypothetical protein